MTFRKSSWSLGNLQNAKCTSLVNESNMTTRQMFLCCEMGMSLLSTQPWICIWHQYGFLAHLPTSQMYRPTWRKYWMCLLITFVQFRRWTPNSSRVDRCIDRQLYIMYNATVFDSRSNGSSWVSECLVRWMHRTQYCAPYCLANEVHYGNEHSKPGHGSQWRQKRLPYIGGRVDVLYYTDWNYT